MKKRIKIISQVLAASGIFSLVLFGILGNKIPIWTIWLMAAGGNLNIIADFIKEK